MKKRDVTIGLKSKTGRAIAVALGGPASSPEFILRQEVALSDSRRPATGQPFHEVMELPWSEWLVAVQPTIEAIEKIAAASLAELIENLASRGCRVTTVAVVGPADRKLERIGNPHIRAHAAEGVLFRRVLEVAAKANRCRSRSFVDPASELKAPQAKVTKVIAALGKIAGSPWRSDEKSAAIAAWAVLSRPSSP
ncbi:MAG TPA: hypothetical protein VII12_08840 [Thermoanaerobaculia bacterium]